MPTRRVTKRMGSSPGPGVGHRRVGSQNPIVDYKYRLPGSALVDPNFSYNARIFTPVKQGKTFVADITKFQDDYRRTVRLQGGYWQAVMTIRKPLGELIEIFNNWLGFHFEESVGGVITWEGMVYEMTLNLPYSSRVKTLDKMSNYVKATYTSGSSTATTAAAQQAQSIARYGRKEELLSLDQLNSTTATALRDTYLAESAWPWPRPQDQGGGDEATLDIICCGYVFCMNWRYTTTADNSSSNVGAWISSIITTDCADFIVAGSLAANSMSLTKTLQTPQRCWDQILTLVSLGDVNGNLYRIWVENNRRVHYRQVSKIPEYYIFQGNIVTSMAQDRRSVNQFQVKPGVFRDMDWPITRQDPGSYLTDARDMIIEEVSVGKNSGLSWSSLEFSEAAQIQQQKEYEASGTANDGGGGGGGGGDRTITDAQLEKWGLTRQEWWAIKATPQGKALRATIKKKSEKKKKKKS